MPLLLVLAGVTILALRSRRVTPIPTVEQAAVLEVLTVETEQGLAIAETPTEAAAAEVDPDLLTGLGTAAAASLVVPSTWVNPVVGLTALGIALVAGIYEAQRLQNATFARLFPLMGATDRRKWIDNKVRGMSLNLLTNPWFFAGKANWQESEIVRIWGSAPHDVILERIEENAQDPTWLRARPSDWNVKRLWEDRAHVEGGVVVGGRLLRVQEVAADRGGQRQAILAERHGYRQGQSTWK